MVRPTLHDAAHHASPTAQTALWCLSGGLAAVRVAHMALNVAAEHGSPTAQIALHAQRLSGSLGVHSNAEAVKERRIVGVSLIVG